MLVTIGIDPGNTGGIAILLKNAHLEVFDMPVLITKKGKKVKTRIDAVKLANILRPCARGSIAFVEQVGAMPKQGVTSMFNFGYGAGVIEGVLAGLGISLTKVRPQVWQKSLSVKGKDAAREMAAELYPSHALDFKRKKDHGRADAVLLASWGQLQRDQN